MISHLLFNFYFSKTQRPWLRSIQPSFKQLTEVLNERPNFPDLPTQTRLPEDDSPQVLNHPCEVPHWLWKEQSDIRLYEWCLHVHTTQLPSSPSLPRQSNSIPQNFLPIQPYTRWSVIFQCQQKSFQPDTCSTMFRQPFHAVSAEKQEKKLSHYYIIRFPNHLS